MAIAGATFQRDPKISLRRVAESEGGNARGASVVAFDFDGTLTCRDSFNAFLAWTAGPTRWMLGLARLTPAFTRYAVDRDRGRLKARAIGEFLGGMDEETLAGAAERYAGWAWQRLMRPDALNCWRDWQRADIQLVIVTASPESIVAPFARRLGADRLIGSRLAFDERGQVLGTLVGLNCRGREKVTRLQAEFGAGLVVEAAYGDSDGDREMLAIARQPGYRVFTGRP